LPIELFVIGVPLAFLTLLGMLYWFLFRGGWRYLGPVVLLSVAAISALNSSAPLPALLVPGIIGSVLLGWLGYKLPRRMPRRSSAEPILTKYAKPTPIDRVLGPEDVLGQWRFYVDAVSCSVMIELQAGGYFRQAIVGNSGMRIDGPGGVWTLEGTNLTITAYHSATRGETSSVRWFFGDCQGDLILFVKDDPQAETMLVAIRMEQGENCEQAPNGGEATPSKANKPTRRANSRSPSLFVDSVKP
jgi:hypothetical protein